MMATEFFNTLTIMHPCLAPQIFHTHCFQFLLGITVVPREIEDNGYEKFLAKQVTLYSIWKCRTVIFSVVEVQLASVQLPPPLSKKGLV